MRLHELVVLASDQSAPDCSDAPLSWEKQSGDPDIHNGLSATYKRSINLHLPGPFHGSGCTLSVGSALKLDGACPTLTRSLSLCAALCLSAARSLFQTLRLHPRHLCGCNAEPTDATLCR
jgi:hypothetical protein